MVRDFADFLAARNSEGAAYVVIEGKFSFAESRQAEASGGEVGPPPRGQALPRSRDTARYVSENRPSWMKALT